MGSRCSDRGAQCEERGCLWHQDGPRAVYFSAALLEKVRGTRRVCGGPPSMRAGLLAQSNERAFNRLLACITAYQPMQYNYLNGIECFEALHRTTSWAICTRSALSTRQFSTQSWRVADLEAAACTPVLSQSRIVTSRTHSFLIVFTKRVTTSTQSASAWS